MINQSTWASDLVKGNLQLAREQSQPNNHSITAQQQAGLLDSPTPEYGLEAEVCGLYLECPSLSFVRCHRDPVALVCSSSNNLGNINLVILSVRSGGRGVNNDEYLHCEDGDAPPIVYAMWIVRDCFSLANDGLIDGWMDGWWDGIGVLSYFCSSCRPLLHDSHHHQLRRAGLHPYALSIPHEGKCYLKNTTISCR